MDEDPPHVRQSPSVDRLVVVADQEDAVPRRRQEQRQPELGAVHVLDLVDEQVAAALTPAGEQRRVARERGERVSDEVVEVDGSPIGQLALVFDERLGDRDRLPGRPRPRRP